MNKVTNISLAPKDETKKKAEMLDRLSKARWLARTNMYYLCNQILGYKDVCEEVHYGLVGVLQKFPAPSPKDRMLYDKPIIGADGELTWKYTPIYPDMLDLPDPWRRRLILDFRGSFKTTINIVAHTIQWLLNYPGAAILIVHAKLAVAEDILGEIKYHFTHNRKLRALFPEICPTEREAKEFGNRSQFTLPVDRGTRKEASVDTTSIDSAAAGFHFDIIKFTDAVESNNSGTKERRDDVARKFSLFRSVLETPAYWIDVEGTRYHYDDQYGRIMATQAKLPLEKREWKFYIRGCYKKKLPPEQKEYQFSEDELDLPDLLIAGRKVSWFPKRFPVHVLESMEADEAAEEFDFNTQYRNHPVGDSKMSDFPADVVKFIPEEALRQIRMVHYVTTVDTAEKTARTSNYSVITTCGWDENNRAYVVDVRRGKYKPDELVDLIFEVYFKWKPVVVKIEQTSYTRGLKFGMDRIMHTRGISVPLDFVPTDNQKTKQEKIRLTLQPVMRRGDLRFSDGLPEDVKTAIYQEFTQFPKGSDDILDTLCDQFNGKDFYGRLRERKPFADIQKDAFRSMIMYGMSPNPEPPPLTYWDVTGGL